MVSVKAVAKKTKKTLIYRKDLPVVFDFQFFTFEEGFDLLFYLPQLSFVGVEDYHIIHVANVVFDFQFFFNETV